MEEKARKEEVLMVAEKTAKVSLIWISIALGMRFQNMIWSILEQLQRKKNLKKKLWTIAMVLDS